MLSNSYQVLNNFANLWLIVERILTSINIPLLVTGYHITCNVIHVTKVCYLKTFQYRNSLFCLKTQSNLYDNFFQKMKISYQWPFWSIHFFHVYAYFHVYFHVWKSTFKHPFMLTNMKIDVKIDMKINMKINMKIDISLNVVLNIILHMILNLGEHISLVKQHLIHYAWQKPE